MLELKLEKEVYYINIYDISYINVYKDLYDVFVIDIYFKADGHCLSFECDKEVECNYYINQIKNKLKEIHE